MPAAEKRKLDDNVRPDIPKRLKLTASSVKAKSFAKRSLVAPAKLSTNMTAASIPWSPKPVIPAPTSIDASEHESSTVQQEPAEADDSKTPKRVRRKKLAPPRPFPIVPPSVSATGPRSAHTEGKNLICVTRKTKLGAYMRRCKGIILEDGYKTLHLSAMGAAIPHLAMLVASLPPILPFPEDEIETEITTGTVEVQDEIIPSDEDADISYETRGKSTMQVIFKIGDGIRDEKVSKSGRKRKGKKLLPELGERNIGQQQQSGEKQKRKGKGKGKGKEEGGAAAAATDIVYEEPEQEVDML